MTVATQEPRWRLVWRARAVADLIRPPAWRRRSSASHDQVEALSPLSPRLELFRGLVVMVFVLAAGLLLQLTVFSSLQERAVQQRLYDDFRSRLAEGTAPTGPIDNEGVVVPIGAPVAYLAVPEIDLRQVVVSGTTSRTLFAGPGQRRDSVLPGQAGTTVIMGRRAAFGGPFARIDDLDPGDRISVTTGQGDFDYRVLGVRREGDPLPSPPAPEENRLVLTTADGVPYLPSGVLRVDAILESTASAGPGRLFPANGLPASEEAMAADTGETWALVLWLQALAVVTLVAVWAWHRWGRAQAWVVLLPVVLLVAMSVSNQAARLLPNLL